MEKVRYMLAYVAPQMLPFVFMALLLLPLHLYADNSDDVKQKMNCIKLDENYLYGEDYDSDMEAAYGNALQELLAYANEIRWENGKEELVAADIIPYVTVLRYSDAGRCVTMVYMGYDEALSLSHNQGTDSMLPGMIFVPSEPADSVVVAPIPETQSFPESGNVSQSNADSGLDELTRKLCDQDNWIEIKGFLTSYKQSGNIRQTGNCYSLADVPADAYAILVDEMYGILAILTPVNNNQRTNCKTNQRGSVNNWPGTKIIVWYK